MNILYLGDNAGTSAAYLSESLVELEHTVTHYDSASALPELQQTYDVIIVSDYPASLISAEQAEVIKEQVNKGSRFIMIGGWDSFNGRGINYHLHPLHEMLPVTLQEDDDRVNAPQGLILKPDPALQSAIPLDWLNPPVICGYNAFETKEGTHTLVYASPIKTDGLVISLLQPQPFVVSIEQKYIRLERQGG